jgi:hypothetical protein
MISSRIAFRQRCQSRKKEQISVLFEVEQRRSMTHTAVTIPISPESQPSTPSWFGEVAAFAQVLAHLGKLEAVMTRVHTNVTTMLRDSSKSG